jgi:hypothetical protein
MHVAGSTDRAAPPEDQLPGHLLSRKLRGRRTDHEGAGLWLLQKQDDLLTAGNMAKELGVSDSRAKKAIAELAIQPKTKKGACCYYSRDELTKINATIK